MLAQFQGFFAFMGKDIYQFYILNSIIQRGFWDKEEKCYMSLQCLQCCDCGCDPALPVLFPSAFLSPSFVQLSPACLTFFTTFKGNSRWPVQCAKVQSFQKRLSRALKILIHMHCNAIGFHLSPSTFPSMVDKQSHIPSLQEGIQEI